MKKLILALMLLISGTVMAQKVVHKMEVISLETKETISIEIIDLDGEYLFKSSNQEDLPNTVVDDLYYINTLQKFLEKEWISPDEYVLLKQIHAGGNEAGDKGKVTGDPNASGYYGIGGDGSGGNYRLGNRNALNKPKPTYDCNEEGKVVVSISVDQSGRVIAADPGIKETTNSAPCLLNRAKEAALKTKFNADSKAPLKQMGAIIYNFSLSE